MPNPFLSVTLDELRVTGATNETRYLNFPYNDTQTERTSELPPSPRFGFEAEFDTGVETLTSLLFERGLTGTNTPHRYHCTCPACDFESGHPFRVQTDSSCDGEVISAPFSSFSSAFEAMEALQEAALEADAEPGFNSGFHVHVNVRARDGASRRRALWAFIMWEHVLGMLASGRFANQRSNNTRLQHSPLRYALSETVRIFGLTLQTINSTPTYEDYRMINGHPDAQEHITHMAYDLHASADRHSNLNINTSYGTWEYRLWNSTRSAWRMLLFSELSIALTVPNAVDVLINNAPYGLVLETQSMRYRLADEDISVLKTFINAANFDDDHLERQIEYINDFKGTAEPFISV